MKKISLSTQNKLILLGLSISTILIIVIAIFSIMKVQEKLDRSYSEFGKILAKTLAVEAIQINNIENPISVNDFQNEEILKTTSNQPYFEYENLKKHTLNIVKSNKDISFIEFKDNSGNIIYSSKEDYVDRVKANRLTANSPLNIQDPENPASTITIGTVYVGMTGSAIKNISLTVRNLMLAVFAVTWVVFSLAMIINTLLLTREISILHHGVRKISTGQFGYKLDSKGFSGETKELVNAFNDMSSRLHLYEEKNIDQLTLEKNKLEAVLMSIANGVVVCDNFDNIVLANTTALKMLEVEEAQFLGTKIQQYCDSDGELCFKSKIEQFKDTPLDLMENKPIDFNIKVDCKILKANISPMFSKSSDYVGYIIVLIDITKENEINNLKNQFISNVSHELRTPVTILRSYIDTLHNHNDEFDMETKKEFIGIIDKESDRLQKMVNDILDFSRLESGNLNLEKEQKNIIEIIEQALNSMQVLAQEKNLTFSLIKEPDLPQVPVNVGSIDRVLKNLLSNAIKYSPEGDKIKIRAEIARDPKYIEVSIEDHGCGIPNEYQDKIFERFFRIENATHTIRGTGLGLHLVKITVEKHHNGQVFVKSRANEGSTFGFRLPIGKFEEDLI